MRKTTTQGLALCLLAGAIAAAGPGAALGQRGEKAAPGLSGTLEEVNAAKNTVTISIFSRKEGESTEKTLPLAKDAKIQQDGAVAKLADLKRGARATLELSADRASVVAVSVNGRTLIGSFYDVGKKTIVVRAEARGGVFVDRTHPLAKDVKVVIAGKAAALADLKEGMTLVLTTAAGAEDIIRIEAKK